MLFNGKFKVKTKHMTSSWWQNICSYSIVTISYSWDFRFNSGSKIRYCISVGRNWTSTWNAIFCKFWTNFSPVFTNITIGAWANIINTWNFYVKACNFFFQHDRYLELRKTKWNIYSFHSITIHTVTSSGFCLVIVNFVLTVIFPIENVYVYNNWSSQIDDFTWYLDWIRRNGKG